LITTHLEKVLKGIITKPERKERKEDERELVTMEFKVENNKKPLTN
jgi:hypothetical protein